jgi:drug/metabolite transporter (DMT)-like permease
MLGDFMTTVRAPSRAGETPEPPMISARFQVLTSAVLFSTAGAAIKACHLTGWQVAAFRALVAALAAWAILKVPARAFTRRVVPVAAAYAVTVILFAQANKMTTAANSIFLQATSPLYLVVLSPWLLGERPGKRDLAFMIAIAVGMAFFLVALPPPAATAPRPRLGNVLAILSGMTGALMMLGLRWLARVGHGEEASAAPAAVVLGNVLAFALALPFVFPLDARPEDAALIAYLGIVQIAVAYKFLLAGLRHLAALTASLLGFVEPVLSPVWAWLVHGEEPGAFALLGGAVILGATALRTWAGDGPARTSAAPPIHPE